MRGLCRQVTAVIAALGFSAALAAPLGAQTGTAGDPAARRTAMERVSFMVGAWAGDAWAMTGPGTRREMRQTESIRYALGGQVLLVEGVGRALANGVVGDTVFHAVATIDWLPDRGYLMRSYITTGHYGEFPIIATDSGYTWETEARGGKVQYRMHLTPEGVFDERGWFITAEGREVPTLGMLLRRVPTP